MLLPQNLARKYGKNPARLAENIAVFDFAPEGGEYGGAERYGSKPSHQPRPIDF